MTSTAGQAGHAGHAGSSSSAASKEASKEAARQAQFVGAQARFGGPKLPEVLDLIDGQTAKPKKMLEGWITDPNTGAKLERMVATEKADVDRAIAAAHRVHTSGIWANTPPAERAAILNKIADALGPHVEEIARLDAATTGAIVKFTSIVAMIVQWAFRLAAGEIARLGTKSEMMSDEWGRVDVHRKPLGPAVCIAPWNAPSGISAHKVASALAAGCPCILKPSEFTPHSVHFLIEACRAAGLPDGVFQLVHGGAEVGAQLVGDARVRAVSFTGGLIGGRAVAAACARDFKPAQLELGGNNCMVVFEDADVDAVAEAVVAGLTSLNGQWCRALGRLIVHGSLEKRVVAAALERLAKVRVGHSLDPEAQMGPLVHARHRELVAKSLAELVAKGGKAHSTTPLPSEYGEGFFFAPTLVTGLKSSQTLEEIFGPVAAVHTFSSEAEALAMANEAPFGLGGYVFGSDEERCRRFAEQMSTGEVKINGVVMMSPHIMAPRPAWNLSGMGTEGTTETFEFFRGSRVVAVMGPTPKAH
eukprot:TRINITY_DN6946_c0_g1_i1.p1 TRINITY_DN6946_c0_g1~~TRINITY_DN6946_c0_g1_i1.p1  ORF type:complete len:608 (-),score=145.05 TRINITY_DN6946_c0_g1_i1:40-1632(-)